jgi:hypothetical protein
VRRPSEAPRRVGEAVNESFGSIVPAFQASILLAACNHALTRVAISCRRFAPRFLARPAEAQGCQCLPDQPRRGGTVVAPRVSAGLRRPTEGALKARHSSHAGKIDGWDLFTASERRRTATSEGAPPHW